MVSFMPRKPLNPQGGDAAAIRTKLADADIARLKRLAARRSVKPGTVARELLRFGLDAAERDTGPPTAA
jgi:hypothetical protein